MALPISGDFERVRSELANELRQRRVAARMNGRELAARARMSPPKLSKIELARMTPSEQDVARIADALDVTPSVRERLVLAARGLATDWMADHVRTQSQIITDPEELLVIERQASLIRTLGVAYMPGLLQTPAYIRKVLRKADPFTSDEVIDHRIVSRMKRQAFLFDRNRSFHFVLLEHALRNRMGSPELMRAQTELLLERMALPNVRLGIVPADVELPAVPIGCMLFVDDRYIVMDSYVAAVILQDTSELQVCLDAFHRFASVACEGAEAESILRAASDHWSQNRGNEILDLDLDIADGCLTRDGVDSSESPVGG